ncbi:MAG: glycoside hydrolase family 15 protein, partial [Chloroflexota bacterium]|nr:glycoside hydrolase family 15 protein [Chloroflexota bacterium]
RQGRFDRDTAGLLVGLGHTVCRRWREPDAGIWERRGDGRQHTHSKVLCWVALDRLLRLHERGQLNAPVALFSTHRHAIRAEIEARGYNERLGSYTTTLDGDDVDASLLALPLYGYVDAAAPRMRSTCARIRERLGRDGLVFRSAPTGGEGAFGICGFWAVECLAGAGDLDAATRAFEDLLGYANDLGLYAEEIAPETGAHLGNFPQAFTHVGLINAATTLARLRAGGHRASPAPRHTLAAEGHR